MKNKFLIGKILKPRGLKGELKIQILTNVLDVFTSLKKVYIGNNDQADSYTVVKSSIQNEFAYISIKDVTTVERAEDFRDMQIFVNKNQLEIADDEIIADDILGFEIINQKGVKLGVLKSIENYGGSDFLNLGNELEIPYEEEFIIETNMTDKKILVKWG
ncbi:MAG: ribosome maturation factor RimM [Firmicutes bacterium]|nr:ribosome maturation factor RimM [Bacillota bacterium]